jgi:hypothetical protein
MRCRLPLLLLRRCYCRVDVRASLTREHVSKCGVTQARRAAALVSPGVLRAPAKVPPSSSTLRYSNSAQHHPRTVRPTLLFSLLRTPAPTKIYLTITTRRHV